MSGTTKPMRQCGCQEHGDCREKEGDAWADDRDGDAGDARAQHRRDDTTARVGCIRPVPKWPRHKDRVEGPSAHATEWSCDGGRRHDRNEQPGRQAVQQRQHSDRGDAAGAHEVVDPHQSDARPAIQERACNRTHDDAGNLAADDDYSRQGGRMMGLEDKQDEQH